ncbi:hypothetical protein P2H44_06305 [Albimonas sp. CAU 1670]|uniref:hypothetical protein n=1 Tax=Albimonas sp. CAU 1670 TaxID=3032599 RepID=UPI0023DCE9DD|nr:hypothetical protein [Albimonas sp. CAU 1670]MDF2232161.1 hypothetical protein [Albimonas sp. CAU 1670]
MTDKTSAGSAGHGLFRVTPARRVFFDPQGGDGAWAEGVTQTRLRGLVRDKRGALALADLAAVDVTADYGPPIVVAQDYNVYGTTTSSGEQSVDIVVPAAAPGDLRVMHLHVVNRGYTYNGGGIPEIPDWDMYRTDDRLPIGVVYAQPVTSSNAAGYTIPVSILPGSFILMTLRSAGATVLPFATPDVDGGLDSMFLGGLASYTGSMARPRTHPNYVHFTGGHGFSSQITFTDPPGDITVGPYDGPYPATEFWARGGNSSWGGRTQAALGVLDPATPVAFAWSVTSGPVLYGSNHILFELQVS